ncbi:PrsW family intramembrane metalloprotease [Tsukamurella sp. 8F]|uniref:PrsW family intramembrane metalloprotease n=1 Tax=unclassified Tsukamurella TaxID=2633480 RepID=UPI0023B9EAA0|nr:MULTISPECIES: PrsW family intramembrane metalloprotease [unclassified Tsukamurella]MDF0532381.1 PrsW family intramembrane metalloprotease [Tsukamurella sp. 8J]MDF0588633.1 PrsW family intramembrane metalloprotease [Tsukamurella sp. 8F]
MTRLWWQPRSACYWVFVLAVVGGAVALCAKLPEQLSYTASGVLAALPVIVVGGLVVAGILLALDVSGARVPAVILPALLWGGLAATGLAIVANGFATRGLAALLNDPTAADWGAAIAGPIDEESLKILGVLLILVLFRSEVRRPLQGFVVGGFVGLGFQMVENITYASTFALRDPQSDVTGALTVSALRAVTGLQSHWVYTAVFAAGLTRLLYPVGGSRAAALLLTAECGAIAYLLHFWWNAPGPASPAAAFGLIVVKGMVTVTIAVVVWLLAVRNQRLWLESMPVDPAALSLAPPAELATLPTGARRRAAVAYMGHYWGPQYAAVTRERQRWLLRELTRRA